MIVAPFGLSAGVLHIPRVSFFGTRNARQNACCKAWYYRFEIVSAQHHDEDIMLQNDRSKAKSPSPEMGERGAFQ
jgi:hypothetical protein